MAPTDVVSKDSQTNPALLLNSNSIPEIFNCTHQLISQTSLQETRSFLLNYTVSPHVTPPPNEVPTWFLILLFSFTLLGRGGIITWIHFLNEKGSRMWAKAYETIAQEKKEKERANEEAEAWEALNCKRRQEEEKRRVEEMRAWEEDESRWNKEMEAKGKEDRVYCRLLEEDLRRRRIIGKLRMLKLDMRARTRKLKAEEEE